MIVISPMKRWVVDVLEERENNPNASNNKIPFVIMSSGAKVLKRPATADTKYKILEKVKEIVSKKEKADWNGCIITNQIDTSINYNLGNTIVGKDFYGTTIQIKEESGRKISPPIIEAIDIDTNSTNNTLKHTIIHVRCFSLKQFEIFELFFCKPGMHILLEYGEGSQQSLLNSGVLVSKNNYDTFIKDFKDYTDPTKNQFAKYHKICETSKGTYDRCAGRVTDYDYSVGQDGTYEVKIKITQGNEYNFALPRSFSAKQSIVATPNTNLSEFEQIVLKVKNDFSGLDPNLNISENEWKNDFFNFIKKSETNKDTSTSSTPYISLRFVLSILLNNYILQGGTAENFKFNIPDFYEIDDKTEPIIPITIHKDIISSNDFCIFPNEQMPSMNIISNEIAVSSLVDGRINKKSIIENRDVYYTPDGIEKTKITPYFSESTSNNNDFRIGNALNIFLNYEVIGELWERNYLKIDFLVDVLDHINKNAYGMFELRYSNLRELSNATIMDVKLKVLNNAVISTKPNYRKEYRFKPNTIKSNVRSFSFNFTMGNTLAAQTMLNNGKFLASIKEGMLANEALQTLPQNEYVFQSIDYSNFSTADGYFAINQIEYEQLTPVKPIEKKKVDDNTIVVPVVDNGLIVNLNKKIIKFKDSSKKDVWPTLIFKDPSFVATKILKVTDPNTKKDYELLTNVEINLTIDGISGITCGETFKLDGVPEQFNRLGVFQIMNTTHNINKDGWITGIKARYNPYGS